MCRLSLLLRIMLNILLLLDTVRPEDLKCGIRMESGYFSSTPIFGSTSTTPVPTTHSLTCTHLDFVLLQNYVLANTYLKCTVQYKDSV